MERWKDIPGYEGIYQVSDKGGLRTCEGKTTYTKRHGTRRWKQRVMKQKICRSARGRTDARIILWKDGTEKTFLVARLVGLAWCDGYAEGMTINHINGNPLDNRAENLEWVTLEENIRKGFADGLYSSIQSPVVLADGNGVYKFDSMSKASEFLGRNKGYISNCIKCGRTAVSQDGNRYDIQQAVTA